MGVIGQAKVPFRLAENFPVLTQTRAVGQHQGGLSHSRRRGANPKLPEPRPSEMA